MRSAKRTAVPLIAALVFFLGVIAAGKPVHADTSGADFENFALGDVNGQNGWTSGHGSSFCPVYDVAVVPNTYGYSSFGAKSLRISDAITCGSFNDQTFSRSLANEAGETLAGTSTFSGGTRQPYFEAQWDFASTVPGAQQPGLSVVASPNRGDTMRMSWVQMQDTPSGLQVNFEDYSHSISNFVLTPVATGLDRTVPHTVKITMQFIDGAGNDIVKVYVDGALVHTGTTWEDYYRDFAGGIPFPVDSVMFRVAGTAVPADMGKGFLIDNFSSLSGPVPTPPPPPPTATSTDFENFTLGKINGQNGWRASGSSGSGCAVYDEGVASSLGTPGFGNQSFRISNAVTSGCFGDQAFSRSLVNEAGETTAQTNGFIGAVRQPYFESQFDIASAVPNAQQPGLSISISPNGGLGARMSYLRFVDQPDGIHVFFDDYQDVPPLGTLTNPANGCGAGDNFVETDIATLDRSVPHTIRFSMNFLEGPANDIVKVYIDGNLAHTGTSWEDYTRWCTESGGGVVNGTSSDVSRTVDSMLFRAGGTAVPANAGKGFLIDNLSYFSGPVPAPPAPPVIPQSPFLPPASPPTSAGAPVVSNANFSGQAYPGSSINVFRKSEVTGPYESIPLTSTVVANDGTFRITIQNFLQANYFFAIQATDKDGRQSRILPLISGLVPSGSDLITQGILVPPTTEMVLSAIPPGQPIQIAGYAAPSSIVEVWIDNAPAGQTVANNSGSYTFTTSTARLSIADHFIKARFITQNGGKSDFSLERTFKVSALAFPKTDLNGDGIVNITDLSIFLSRWGSPDQSLRSTIDFDGDGKVDVSDFSILLNSIRLQ